MMNPSRPASGYSLTELLIVITVIGIALAGGAPYLAGYTRSRGFQQSADQLVGQLDLARNHAIAETNPYRILFNSPEDGQYQVHDDDNGDGNVDEGEGVRGPFDLPNGSSFADLGAASDEGVLTFEPSGMLEDGQGGTIGLSSECGMALNLEVFASGMAKITPAS